jgi:hypothetical protein
MDTTQPRLSRKFFEALHYAAELHNNQVRKGGEIPYIGHLLSVAGLVLEADGNETPSRIRNRLGNNVSRATSTTSTPRPTTRSWSRWPTSSTTPGPFCVMSVMCVVSARRCGSASR